MKQELEKTIALLARTPAALDGLLRGLPEDWVFRNEGENTWSAFDIVSHLIYGERADWMPRLKLILRSGEGQAFEPFDRLGHIRESKGKSMNALLDSFSRSRSANLDELRALKLSERELAMRGRHPEFGSVTLSELLATWAAHDLDHLHQIARVMAHQYREAVGPWREYLGVLKCDAHGVK